MQLVMFDFTQSGIPVPTQFPQLLSVLCGRMCSVVLMSSSNTLFYKLNYFGINSDCSSVLTGLSIMYCMYN